MKQFWNNFKTWLFKAGGFLKSFFSYWRNCVMAISLVASFVLFFFWNFSIWFKVLALGFLAVGLLFVAIMLTEFYRVFSKAIQAQKQELLENLAIKFDKEEYLQLKTPFNEKEEKFLQERIKFFRNLMIFAWFLLVVVTYVLIAVIF